MDSAIPMLNSDGFVFFTQLLESKSAWHGLAGLEMKRFFPLAGWNLALIAQFSLSPYAFMLGNACVLVAFGVCYLALGRQSRANHWAILVMFVCVVLSVGYAKLMVEIVFPETTLTLFILAFLLCYFYALHSQSKPKSWLLALLALLFGNAAIYLKEVAFVIISGFGLAHIALSLLESFIRTKSLTLTRRIFLLDIALALSGVVFLGAYAYFTRGSSGDYSAMEIYSSVRLFAVLFLSAPLLSIALPVALGFRLYRVAKGDAIDVFWDSVGLSGFAYMLAFIALGMGSFHYFTPANILASLYLLFLLGHYACIKRWGFRVITAVVLAILLTSSIPQGIHYLTFYKTQNKNINDTMRYLASYLKSHPHTTIYFEGFGRGVDRYYNAWSYPAIFSILPTIFGVREFDIASKEPNGTSFSIDPHSSLSFFNSQEVSTPDSSDLLIITALSDMDIADSRITELESSHELLFKTSNHPYFPQYTLMSIGAKLLQDLGISHPLSNYGNPYRLPAQSYIFRIP
ncbi:hypothetical protein [Helicobacter canis]|uniref:Glycosyltransferase RgtA/B/C/D-like domain-containing protein n=1 Tax=Helicobacter canis TaxID=29419 RepID=A0A377J2Q3_9HELI|nr:hypothetical protein [Helicobacter canis]STO96730.1 Uncharacterised protein [Helicobacter canis]